jgi:hypothetical protein
LISPGSLPSRFLDIPGAIAQAFEVGGQLAVLCLGQLGFGMPAQVEVFGNGHFLFVHFLHAVLGLMVPRIPFNAAPRGSIEVFPRLFNVVVHPPIHWRNCEIPRITRLSAVAIIAGRAEHLCNSASGLVTAIMSIAGSTGSAIRDGLMNCAMMMIASRMYKAFFMGW